MFGLEIAIKDDLKEIHREMEDPFMVCMDLEKDWMGHSTMWRVLQLHGMSKWFLEVVKNLYENCNNYIRVSC